MKLLSLFAISLSAGLPLAAQHGRPHGAKTIGFDIDAPGAPPRGWSQAMTSAGGAPKWEVLRDDAAPSRPHVLAQTSTDATRGRFPLAVLDDSSQRDGEVSVRCRAVSGKIDQACGLVWRYRDENNYYIVRSNALENNVVLYKVQDGQRTALAPLGTPAGTYGVKARGAFRRLEHAGCAVRRKPVHRPFQREAAFRSRRRHILGAGQNRPVDESRFGHPFRRFHSRSAVEPG